jgi:hypothetical protein
MGEETNFDFKYIPNFDTTSTDMGDYVAGLKSSGIERRNLRALVLFSAVMGLVSRNPDFPPLFLFYVWDAQCLDVAFAHAILRVTLRLFCLSLKMCC